MSASERPVDMKGMVVLEIGVPPSMARRESAAGTGTEMGAAMVAVAKVNLRVTRAILEREGEVERRKSKVQGEKLIG
jgi:hypothetical protein